VYTALFPQVSSVAKLNYASLIENAHCLILIIINAPIFIKKQVVLERASKHQQPLLFSTENISALARQKKGQSPETSIKKKIRQKNKVTA